MSQRISDTRLLLAANLLLQGEIQFKPMEEPHVPERAQVEGMYGNHFQIGYNAFEFVVDFAQAHDDQIAPRVHTRVITTPAYARVLSVMLAESVQQYEKKFGAIPRMAER